MEENVIDYQSEMTFVLSRFYSVKDNDAIAKLGYLTNKSGSIGFATVENLYYMIPEGEYIMTYTKSPAFSMKEPYKSIANARVPILSVPKRLGIRIHAGNWAGESKGCILIGTHHVNDMVCNSRRAYNMFMNHVVKYGFAKSVLIVKDSDDSGKYQTKFWQKIEEELKAKGLCLRKKS